MKRAKIAIIGGGGAGATAAWLLDQVHDVTVFEAQAHLGGHAYTHHMKVGDAQVHIDMGVEYFNERLSPNLFALHRKLGLETYVAPLSFRASFPGNDAWTNIGHDGRLRGRLSAEFDRFHLDMAHLLNSGEARFKRMTVGEFMHERGYSEAFACQGLLPLMTTFSGCNAPSLDYNLMYVAISFNMSLLSFFAPGYWRKSAEGIDGYLRILHRELGDKVRLNTPVSKVSKRRDGRLELATATQTLEFDQVVFATHADVTLGLLDNPSPRHRDILSRFEYVNTRSVLHSDTSVLAPGQHDEYCEFVMPGTAHEGHDRTRYGHLTRNNNNLPPYAGIARPLLVTFDPKHDIAPEKIDIEKRWKLPKLRPGDFYQKTRYRTIQGVDNMWFCGTDTSLTGHEGATVSGMVVAERLGATYPFATNTLASIQFNVIKDLMGVRRPSERLFNATGDLVYSITKRLSLHKNQSHKFIKDIFV